MSDGSGVKRIEAVTVAGFCIAAILGTLFLLYTVGLLNGEQAERRQNYPHSHAESAKQQAERACVGTDPGAIFECVVDYVEASEETAYTEQDLTAQQRAAWGALMAAFAGILSIGVSALGLYWIKGTLDATREAVVETEKATAAMFEANEIARSGHAANFRAWLKSDMKSVALVFGNDAFVTASFVVTNIGQTPATRVWYTTRLTLHGASWKLPDMSVALQLGQDSLLNNAGFRGRSLFIKESDKMVINATVGNPDLLEHHRREGNKVWLTLAVRFFYESQGKPSHTDKYYRIGGPEAFARVGLRGLDPKVALHEVCFENISGGTIA